jgi:hypothetical protein
MREFNEKRERKQERMIIGCNHEYRIVQVKQLSKSIVIIYKDKVKERCYAIALIEVSHHAV